MQTWQTLLRFGDAHPWFLPSVAAVFTLLGVAYKASTWLRRMIRGLRERWEDGIVAGYLVRQINTGSREADKYGHSPRLQKDCTIHQIAYFVKNKPFKVREILERLETQMRTQHRGNQSDWSATDYEMRQPIGLLVKLRLYFLQRSYLSRQAKSSIRSQ
jgi:hypothetical protein